jgi:Ca2+-binding RTX toxin-like protein
VIKGGEGNDVEYGGEGNDSMWVGRGADVEYGGPGDDVLHAPADDNRLDIVDCGAGHVACGSTARRKA